MPVTERLMGIGSWSLKLRPDTPISVIEDLDLSTASFGHILITPTHFDATPTAATVQAVARYAGVLRSKPDLYELGGPGLAMWLADEDGKGDVIEAALAKTAGTFVQWVTDLRPSSLDAGTFTAIAGTLTHTFLYVDRRTALDYVSAYFGGEWKIAPSLALHCGAQSNLFVTTPTVVVQRRDGGRDPGVTGLRTDLKLDTDQDDYTTRVVLRANDGSVGTADISPATTFRDGNGNLVEFTRIIDSSGTQVGNQTTVAQAQLNRFTSQRKAVALASDVYDIGTDVEVGDTIYVWDPDLDLTDQTNQIQYRGQLIFPLEQRVLGYTWPVKQGMGVYFRAPDVSGTLTDLTDWVEWETGLTKIEVGAKPRATEETGSAGAYAAPVVRRFNSGVSRTNTDAGGNVVVAHGLGATPTAVITNLDAVNNSAATQQVGKAIIGGLDAINFAITAIRSDTGATLPSQIFDFHWIATT